MAATAPIKFPASGLNKKRMRRKIRLIPVLKFKTFAACKNTLPDQNKSSTLKELRL